MTEKELRNNYKSSSKKGLIIQFNNGPNNWTDISPKLSKNGEVINENVLNLTNHAAAAAKSLQSCLTLCNPIDGSPPGSPVPGILQARTLE